MSDDQDAASLGQAMPRTKRLARTGTTFTDFVVTTPSCCPSRAAFITGEYGHNNGVLANVPGYPDLLEKENVLPAWLRHAGYRTAEFGKFMNGYENFATAMGALRGPGWDQLGGASPAVRLLRLRPLDQQRAPALRSPRPRLPRRCADPARAPVHQGQPVRPPAVLRLAQPLRAARGARWSRGTCREVPRQRDPRARRREPLQGRRRPHASVLRRAGCLRQALLRPGSAAGGCAPGGEVQAAPGPVA